MTNPVYALTTFYAPYDYLETSLKQIYKMKAIDFKHYLLDNNFPLEKERQNDVKKLCEDYGITYMNFGKNYGQAGSQIFFREELKIEGANTVLINLEPDAYPLTIGFDKAFVDILSGEFESLPFLNNTHLRDYKKEIKIHNGIKYFELIVNSSNLQHSWVQMFSYNCKRITQIDNEIMSNGRKGSYDVVGTVSERMKNTNYPMIVINDYYENMDYLRYDNYLEYEYWKSLVYYQYKFDDSLNGLTFEQYCDNIDYYIRTEYLSEFVSDFLKKRNMYNVREKMRIKHPLLKFAVNKIMMSLLK